MEFFWLGVVGVCIIWYWDFVGWIRYGLYEYVCGIFVVVKGDGGRKRSEFGWNRKIVNIIR